MKVILIALLLQLATTQLMADDASVPDPWNQFEIGPEVFIYNYKEPGLMKLNGTLYGIDMRFSRYIPRIQDIMVGDGDDASVIQKEHLFVLRFDGRYAMGENDYDGTLQDSTPYKISNIDATSYEFRGLVGYSAWMRPERETVVYVGLGSRFKDDDSSFDEAGYKRESSYMYLPVLIEHTRTMLNGRTLAFTFEYNLFLSGEQVSHLPFDNGITKIKNTQDSGYGYRFSMAYAGTTDSGIRWTLEPYFRTWDIDDSNISYMRSEAAMIFFFEPKNTTQEIGISARVLF